VLHVMLDALRSADHVHNVAASRLCFVCTQHFECLSYPQMTLAFKLPDVKSAVRNVHDDVTHTPHQHTPLEVTVQPQSSHDCSP
jgi:hypothetical protein